MPTVETRIRAAKETRTVLDGRTLRLTHLDKVYFPEDGVTKGDVLRYYATIGEVMARYLRNRPLTVVRYPDGIDDSFFYQKNRPANAPVWIPSVLLGETNFCLAQERAAVVWFANQGAIEFHPWPSRVESIDCPDWAVFDLDPAEGATFAMVRTVALAIRELLARMGLVGFPKLSGATGLHVYVPLGGPGGFERHRRHNEGATYGEVTDWVGFWARFLEMTFPDIVTTERLVKNRTGKIYVDHLQNQRTKTIAAPYTLRPLPGAPVSWPVTWEELETIPPRHLTPNAPAPTITLAGIEARMAKVGDLFEPLLTTKQSLPPVPTDIGHPGPSF